MSLSKGESQELSSNSPANEDVLKEMRLQLEILSKELTKLKSEEKTQAAVAPSQMSPAQLGEIVAAVVKASKEQPDSVKLTSKSFVDEKNIDPADYDPDGVLFCTYGTGYVIVDDVRQGFAVPTPYHNTILFSFQGQTITRDDKGKVVINTFSAYLSRSKKEQNWLREHKYFGTKFFETAVEAMQTNVDRAQKLSRFINIVMGMDQNQMVANCTTYNIPITNDPRAMRIKLANRMLDAVEDKDKLITRNMLTEKLEEDIFLKDTSKRTPKSK